MKNLLPLLFLTFTIGMLAVSSPAQSQATPAQGEPASAQGQAILAQSRPILAQVQPIPGKSQVGCSLLQVSNGAVANHAGNTSYWFGMITWGLSGLRFYSIYKASKGA